MTRRSSLYRSVRSVSLLACLGAVLVLSGCEALFTFSPFAGLRTSPSDMTPAQRLQYAKDALASGDTAEMKAAYEAIKDDTSADAQYTAAQLAIELSGVADVLREIATDPSTIDTQLNTINDFITSHGLDPTYMVAAATELANAKAAGAVLTDTDCAMGAMGLLLGDAWAASGGTSWDITPAVISDAERDTALAFLAPAYDDVQSLPAGDPQRQFIESLHDFISGL